MSEKKATRAAYGEALIKLGQTNPKVVVLDADLTHSTMTKDFSEQFPERFFNAGIAEADMVDMAAGISTFGYIPFVSTFAVFGAGRAFEQVRNSVAYPRFNVKFAYTHAGITVGEDGASHQSIEDIALMRVIPGMTVIVPADAGETYKAIDAAVAIDGPVYIRLGRLATAVLPDMPFELGRANVIQDGSDIAIFCCGLLVEKSLIAAERLKEQGINAAVINMHTIKPIDSECIREYAAKCGRVLTVEEHSVIGGLGDAVGAEILGAGASVRFKKLGVQDQFGQSGSAAELLKVYGLDEDSIAQAARELCE